MVADFPPVLKPMQDIRVQLIQHVLELPLEQPPHHIVHALMDGLEKTAPHLMINVLL